MRMVVPLVIILVATNIVVTHAQKAGPEKPPALAAPYQTYPNRKPFNAVQLGPGNTFSVSKVPKDYTLVSFTFSPDGRRLALGWESGKIELFELGTGKPLGEFKSGLGSPYLLKFNAAGDRLVVTGQPAQISFLDPQSGKVQRKVSVERGPRKYSIQGVALDSTDRWIAYVNEDDGKVLDLTSPSPIPLADLKDAGSLALSQDGSELWTVNRKVLTRFNTSTWKQTGEWPLESAPINTSPVVVRAGTSAEGQVAVAVPTSKGLLLYREPEMRGDYATNKATNDVAFASASRVFVNLSGVMTFLKPTSEILCERSYGGREEYALSDDGQWLALSRSGKVDVWRMEDLLRDCSAAPRN